VAIFFDDSQMRQAQVALELILSDFFNGLASGAAVEADKDEIASLRSRRAGEAENEV
jgi:hypothetical protein